MADRTWNAIDCDGYSKPWSKCARRIWGHIQMIQPNQYGIFISPLGVIKDHWEDVYSSEQIDQALEELIAVGVIRTYRNGQVMWVVEKFARELQGCNTKRQLAGLNNHLNRYPEVKEDFLEEYEVYAEKIVWALDGLAKESQWSTRGVPKDSKGKPKEPLTNSQRVTKERLISDSDPDPDSEPDSDSETDLKNFSHPESDDSRSGGAGKGRRTKTEDERFTSLAEAVARKIDELVEKYNAPRGMLNNTHNDCAREIRLLLTNDNAKLQPSERVTDSDIIPTLEHAWQSYRGRYEGAPFSWGPQLISIRHWRKKTERSPNGKFWAAWSQWKESTNPPPQQPEPQERRKLRDGIKLEYGDIDQL